MIRYRVAVQPEHRSRLAHLPPSVKQKLHASLRLLEVDPWAGKPLERELTGYALKRLRELGGINAGAMTSQRTRAVVICRCSA